METKVKTDAKTEIIQKFATALEENCKTEKDVVNVIRAIVDNAWFMELPILTSGRDNAWYVQLLRDSISPGDEHEDLFNKMYDTVMAALIVSRQNNRGIDILTGPDTYLPDRLNDIINDYETK